MERKIYRIAVAGTRIEVFAQSLADYCRLRYFLSLNAFLFAHNEIY
jgi:hypothetical protein